MQKISLARTFSSISKGKKYQASGRMGAAESFSLLGFYADVFLIPGFVGEICPGLNLLWFCVLHCNPISHLLPRKNAYCTRLPLFLLVCSLFNPVQLKHSCKR